MRWRGSPSVGLWGGSALAWCLFAVVSAPAQTPDAVPPSLSLEQLACMNWCELEHLYRQASPGTIPAGYTRGRAIYCPGALLTPARDRMTRALWHGKHFCPDDSTLTNQWCAGARAVRARVCYGESWLDGKPSIVMDYRGTSRVIWKDVRDEIREVAPGVYLGLMYRCKAGQTHMKMFFALELSPCGP
ncbi:MAG TPA: hypothetical protein VH643_23750 [Gemmataceae bacterium]